MIALVVSMLRTRRVSAVMLALLATVAFAAAYAIPAFLAAADRSVISDELQHATVDQQVIEATNSYKAQSTWQRPDSAFAGKLPQTMAEPSLSIVYADQFDVMMLGKVKAAPRMQFRQNVCDHVTLVSGRCPTGTGEVMIGASLAASESLAAGSVIPIEYADVGVSPFDGPYVKPVPGYNPLTVNVVGVYRANDTTEPYWGDEPMFGADSLRLTDAPIFTVPGTMSAVDHASELQYVDAVLDPAALQDGQIATVRAQVQHALSAAGAGSSGVGSAIPQLLSSIDNDLTSTHEAVFLIALPLIGIGWVAVFLGSAYAVAGRREEIGIVKLRGARYVRRLWLGSGEAVLSVLIAIPLGYFAAMLGIRLVVGHFLPGHPAHPPIGSGALRYVTIVLAGCLIAVFAAVYRTLATSTPDLLRGVPPRSSRWRTAAVEVLVVVFAAAALEQMLTEQSALAGIDLVAPWFLIAAIGVLAARLLLLIVAWIGRLGLRSRRTLGFGVGALQIARRPGVSRVFVLIVITIGIVTYAAAATGVASAARTSRAAISTGGTAVVSVAPLSRLALLEAVRKADPSGRYAMAVASIPQPASGLPTVLAVDSSRLAAVAAWPSDGMPVGTAARLLNPPVPASIILHGGIMAVDVDVDADGSPPPQVSMELYVQPLDGQQTTEVPFSRADPTKPEYQADAGICRAVGCRIAGLTITGAAPPDGASPVYFGGAVTVTLSSARVVDPASAPLDAFAAAPSWRIVALSSGVRSSLAASPTGMTITAGFNANGFTAQLNPTDNAFPAPALSTRPTGESVQGSLGIDQVRFATRQVGQLSVLPGLPPNAMIIDLQDADRIAPVVGDDATTPAVWLSSSAPSDMTARLRAAGLNVIGVTRSGPLARYLSGQGPAVGSTFYVLSVTGALVVAVIALMLTASVDRTRRGKELRALRTQGLPSHGVASASGFAYIGLTGSAVIAGLAAGLVSWRLTGGKVPIFADGQALVGVSVWPDWTGLVVPLAAAAALLLVVSGAAAWDLRTFVRRGD